MELAVDITDEQVAIEYWRESQLEKAGYPPEAATRLAVNHAVDLHDAIDLINNGCNPTLAERIVT